MAHSDGILPDALYRLDPAFRDTHTGDDVGQGCLAKHDRH
jgi:hypothetical protein